MGDDERTRYEVELIDKSRADARGKSHYKNYRAAAKDIGTKPKRGKC